MERFLPTDSVVFLVNVAWQSAVVLAVALVAERLARRQATVRHSILLAGLLAALGLPVLLATQQRFGVAFLRVPLGFDAPGTPVSNGAEWVAAPPSLIDAPRPQVPDGPPGGNALGPGVPLGPPRIVGVPGVRPTDFAIGSLAARGAMARDQRREAIIGQVTRAAVFVWLFGAAILAWRLLAACWALWRVRRGSVIAEQAVVRAALDLLSEVWEGALPDVRVSGQISAPVSAGVFWPIIFLPESVLQSLSPAQLRDVLLHEAAHIRRNDQLVVLLERLAAIACWPNPLLHRLNFLLDEAREDICDNYVLSKGDAAAYSRTLLELTQAAGLNRLINLASCHLLSRRHLETRIASLLDERRTIMTCLRPSLAATIFAGFLLLAAAVAAVRAQVGPDPSGRGVRPPVKPSLIPMDIPSGAIDIDYFDPFAAIPPSKHAPRREYKADGPVHVRVIDTQGRPQKNVRVRLLNSDRGQTLSTDSTGRIEVPKDWVRDRASLGMVAHVGNDAIGWYSPRGFGRSPDDLLRSMVDLTVYPLSRTVRGKLVDRAGRPAAGVRLKVTGLGNKVNGVLTDPRPLNGPSLLTETLSNSKGEYSLALPDAAYCEVKVASPPYTAKRLVVPTDVDFAALGYVTLCEVGPIDGTKLGVIKLVEAGRIEGRVVDARTGRPLARMSVGCQALATDYSTGWGEATSGADGRYRIGGLSPGVYNVHFSAPANFAGTAASNDGVIVESGKVTTADLVVRDGRRLWGRVVDAGSGHPMSGIPIGYYGPAAPRSGAMCLGRTTDARGEFSFRVPPGPSYVYIMDGKHDAHADVIVPQHRDFGPVVLRVSSTDRRLLEATIIEEQPVTRLIRPGEHFDSTSGDGGVSGVVVDPAGKPIAGARIFHTGHSPDKFVTSDEKGAFVFSGMADSSFTLVACKQGYHAWAGVPHTGDVLRIVLEPKLASPRSAN